MDVLGRRGGWVGGVLMAILSRLCLTHSCFAPKLFRLSSEKRSIQKANN